MREAPKFGQIIVENMRFDDFVEHYIGKPDFVWEDGCVIQKFRDDTQHRNTQIFLFELVRYILSAHDMGTVISGGIPIYIKEKQALRRPDLAVFMGKKIDDIPSPYVESGMDIAIEISSRATTALDRGNKFNEYEIAGIQEYWLIDPVRKDSMIYSLNDNGLYQYISGGNLLKSHLLPDIELDLNILWQDELPEDHAVNQIANNMLPDDLRDKVKLIFYEGRDLYVKIKNNTLKHVDLSGHDLHRAIFIEEDLSYAILNDVKDGRNCIFWKSNLSHAQLMRSNFIMADFQETNLHNANLSESRLHAAEFIRANLAGAVLMDADVSDAKFDNANLCGADMRCQNLEEAIFTDAIYDSKTLWIEGFSPQEHGAIFKT